MFGHIILIATFLHLSYIYVCHLKWLCPDIWAHSIPVGDSLSCCMPRLPWTSSPGAAARARPQCTWNHSTLWKLRMQTTPERDALYRWAMGEIRCSQRIQRISQMVSHGTSSPMVFTALPAKPMSFRAGTQDTECRSVLRWTLAVLYQ